MKRMLLCLVGFSMAACLIFIQGCASEHSAQPSPLEAALASGKPTVAEFGRGTCEPCKKMVPILQDLAAAYKDRLNVVTVSVDDYPELAARFGVSAIPTQIIFDAGGKKVRSHLGVWTLEDIIEHLKMVGIT
jgi:thioredoxin